MDAELGEDVVHHEDRIVSQWREVSDSKKTQLREQIDELVRPLGLQTRLVVLERANSITVFFISETLSALMRLRQQWSSGQLRGIVQSLFTFLLGANKTVRVRKLTWPLTQYERCLQCFNSLQGTATNLNFLHICGLRMC